MKLILLIAVTAITLMSCQLISHKSTELNVCSMAKGNIDSVRILSYGVKEVFKNLRYNEPQKRKVTIEIPDGVKEGGFTIVIYRSDSSLNAAGFGYYTSILDIPGGYNLIINEDFTITQQ